MTPERDENGRFLPGQSGNPKGRAQKSVEAASLDKFRSYYRNGNMDKLIGALQRQIERGNVQAIRLALSYLWGQPPQDITIDSDSIIRVIVSHERRKDNDTGTA